MSIFATDRLIIRAWSDAEGDLAVIQDLYSRPDVIRWLGGNASLVTSRTDALARVERWRSRGGADPSLGVWAVALRGAEGPGPVIGTVLLVPLPPSAHVEAPGTAAIEVGWHLHPDHQGAGYATEAARGAVAYGFAAGLTEIFAVVSPANERSLAVARRLGMTDLGRTDRFYDEQMELFRITPEVVAQP